MTPRLSVVLPHGWHRLPLQPEADRHRAVTDLVSRAAQGADVAALREVLTAELRAAADQAAGAGAQQLVISLMRTDQGVPLPASLVVTVVGTGGRAVDDLVAQGGADDEVLTARVPGGHVVRRVRETTAETDLAAPGTVTLSVDYWLREDDAPHVAVLAFSTPLVALRDGVLPLFDAVVASARWQDPAA